MVERIYQAAPVERLQKIAIEFGNAAELAEANGQ